jgi:peptidoglycan hydrolase-like protein with peptidoglycan-binding domain
MVQIKRGASGLPVRILQYLLGLKVTGLFDAAVDKAVRAFQAAKEIAVDGIVGPITWGTLAASQPVEKRRRMLLGTARVKAIQELIGFTGKDVDGKFGPKTEAAVMAKQKAAGVKVDGIVGLITWTYLLTGEAIVKAVVTQPVDYKQYDSRWASKMYSKSVKSRTIKNNGCGPTAMADVAASRWDGSQDPADVAAYAVAHGYCAEENGTYRSFFAHMAARYKCRFLRTSSIAEVRKALLGGAYVIALMGKGFWTGGGHYICCWRYDPATDLIYANDPASSVRKYATSKSFDKEKKEFFIFYRQAA